MLVHNWKRKLFGSTGALALIGALAVTQIAAAGGINEAGLESLNITEEQYDAAKDSAKEAYNAEMVALGWATAEEAAEANEDDKWVRIGRGQYYKGILDKDDFMADALGVTDAQWEAAEEASFDAKLAERVESGRYTEEEAADKEALHDFKQSIDKDAVLAEAMGISLSDLAAARSANTSYDDLLDSLSITDDEVDANKDAIMQGLVEDAVEDGTLTPEQAEDALSRRGRGNRDGRRGGGRNGGPEGEGGNVGGNVLGAPNVQQDAPPVGSYDS